MQTRNKIISLHLMTHLIRFLQRFIVDEDLTTHRAIVRYLKFIPGQVILQIVLDKSVEEQRPILQLRYSSSR